MGWRPTLLLLAMLHFLICAPLHGVLLRGAPAASTPPTGTPATPHQPGVRQILRSQPFVLVGLFVTLMMAVSVAIPAHLVSLLRENGLAETWVIAMPAAIGLIQVVGRVLLYFFENRVDLHRINLLVPLLIPLALLVLLMAPGLPRWQVAVVGLFVLLYGLGNGMLTIVKGTAIAHYVSQQHVATLNGALGLPLALARALAPWLLGVVWSPDGGYRLGLCLLLASSVAGVAALMGAQRLRLQTH